VEDAYAVDALSCLAMVAALRGMGPQVPAGVAERLSIGASIREGLAFVRRSPALLGSLRSAVSAGIAATAAP